MLKKQYSWKAPRRRISFIIKGILVGIVAGLVVSLFRLLIQKMLTGMKLFYTFTQEHPVFLLYAIIFTIVGSLFIGWLINGEKNIKGSGIPQVKGQIQGDMELHWWSVLWRKFIGGVLSIGSGAFLGREGPSIQLGATVGQAVNQGTGGDSTDEKILITSGAGAGLSAAFNAPVAGLLFGLEEIHHHFSSTLLVTCFVASITSNFVSLNIFGMTPVLYLGNIPKFPLNNYLWLIILGVILAVFGVLYQKILFQLPKWYAKIQFLPSHLYGMIPLLLVIPLGFFSPDLLGGGAEVISILNNSQLLLQWLVIIFLIRFSFSMISYGSGLPGGIFLPLLTLGACIGSIYGNFLTTYLRVDSNLVNCFIVYAMAGYFTAICKAPLTGIILVSEMVGSLDVLMPIAIVSLVAYITADFMGAIPVYDGLLDNLLGRTTHKKSSYLTTFVYPVKVTNSTLVGKKVKDISWPNNSLLVLVRKGEQEIAPHGDTIIQAGDFLYISADAGLESTIRKKLSLPK
ncbi:ClC family H(+)/Cl(-) exchange transporter [Bacillus kwashiorkori]|uniref:ClC family H(+)/Cl(-) exchange transporter n=1 Tax=Bacillus kwashiorkori TaxID=1522318 RepID=UPI00078223E4|nr:ClC family H(+)/Cl(-) exchange transporter [Bacillus kwashiorkori]